MPLPTITMEDEGGWPAWPVLLDVPSRLAGAPGKVQFIGLTKREAIAAQLLGNFAQAGVSMQTAVELAVKHADELLLYLAHTRG